MTELAAKDAEIPLGKLFEDARVRVELVMLQDQRYQHPACFDLPVSFAKSGRGEWGYLQAAWGRLSPVKSLVIGLVGTSYKQIRVHRLVAALVHGKVIGREVHHADHNPLSNRAENLEVMTKAQHEEHHRLKPQHPIRVPTRLPRGITLRVVMLDFPDGASVPRFDTNVASRSAAGDWRLSLPLKGSAQPLRGYHTGPEPSTGEHLFEDGHRIASENRCNAPVLNARQVAATDLKAVPPARAALVLRVIDRQGGPTRTSVIRASLRPRKGGRSTVANTLKAMVEAGLIVRTNVGRYDLAPMAYAG